MFLNEIFIYAFEVINFVSIAFIMFALPLSTLNICVCDHLVVFCRIPGFVCILFGVLCLF